MRTRSPSELRDRIEAERRGDPFLVFRAASGEQRIHTLKPEDGRVSVGRGPETDVRLEGDAEVSGLHADLERSGGQWTVIDDGLSRNGSFLNGERVTGRSRLRDGDSLRFGETLVLFRAPAEGELGETVAARGEPRMAPLTDTQRRILIALCRPYRERADYATPATNQEIGAEVHLSVDAVKGHLRTLFHKFQVEELPQNQKRVRLVELALQGGQVSFRDLR